MKLSGGAFGLTSEEHVLSSVDKRDVDMLEDLVTAAVNDAIRRSKEIVEKEMGKVAGGMDLGPLGDMIGKMGGGNPFGA